MAIFSAVVLAAVAAGAILCNYTPRAYRPPAPAHPEQVSPYLTHELGPELFNNIQLDRPFELRVTQQGLNDILSSQPWVEELEGFSFADPMIVFGQQRLYLMGTLTYKGVSSVLTIRSAPAMDADGRIGFHIDSVRLGVLPVTRLVAMLARGAFEQSRDCFEGEEDVAGVIEAVISNTSFDPVFELSGHTARITDFTLEPGLLTIRFQPEPAPATETGR